MVYPMHFGQGEAGLNGTGFQLLIIIFMILVWILTHFSECYCVYSPFPLCSLVYLLDSLLQPFPQAFKLPFCLIPSSVWFLPPSAVWLSLTRTWFHSGVLGCTSWIHILVHLLPCFPPSYSTSSYRSLTLTIADIFPAVLSLPVRVKNSTYLTHLLVKPASIGQMTLSLPSVGTWITPMQLHPANIASIVLVTNSTLLWTSVLITGGEMPLSYSHSSVGCFFCLYFNLLTIFVSFQCYSNDCSIALPSLCEAVNVLCSCRRTDKDLELILHNRS